MQLNNTFQLMESYAEVTMFYIFVFKTKFILINCL